MARDISPEEFAQEFPDDMWVNEANLRASQLAAILSPQREDESLLDAKHRVDLAFDDLHTEIAREMDLYHAGARSLFTEDFIAKGLHRLEQVRLDEIAGANDFRLKEGGMSALQEEKRLFEERIATNPVFRDESQELVDRQTGRYTAVAHTISQQHDLTLERLGLAHVNEQSATPQQQMTDVQAAIFADLEQARARARTQGRER